MAKFDIYTTHGVAMKVECSAKDIKAFCDESDPKRKQSLPNKDVVILIAPADIVMVIEQPEDSGLVKPGPMNLSTLKPAGRG